MTFGPQRETVMIGVSGRTGPTYRPMVRASVAVLIPVLLVASVLSYAIENRLEYYRGSATGFVHFGSAFAAFTHPPHGAIVGAGASLEGYDGQFYYVMARDPLLLDDSTVASLRSAPQNVHHAVLGSSNQAYRLRRVAYPAFAFLLAKAVNISLAWSMLAINVVVTLLLTGGFAYYAWRRGWSSLWALPLGLLPGLLLQALSDLSGPLATAAALGGLLAWAGRRRKIGVSLLVVAVLAREVMMAAVLALAIEAAVRAWHERGTPGAPRRIALDVWPAVVLPTVALAGWHAYISLRTGGSVGGAGLTLPFVNFVDEFRSLGSTPTALAGWEVAYLLLMIVAVAAALLSLRRQVTAANVAAALFALTVLVAPFNDAWGDARDSLPMLALLLVIGLERREPAWLGICVAAAAMTALVPLAIPGSF